MSDSRSLSNETVEFHFGAQTLTVMSGSIAVATYRDPLLIQELAAINEAMGELRARTPMLGVNFTTLRHNTVHRPT